jgi:hypothetical protein
MNCQTLAIFIVRQAWVFAAIIRHLLGRILESMRGMDKNNNKIIIEEDMEYDETRRERANEKETKREELEK